MSILCFIGRRRLKRLMRTFPSAPSLQSDQFTRMLPDSSGISVDDVSLDIGHSVFVTLHGPDDVASQQQSLSAELDETRHRLMTARDEAWAPLDLVSMIHHYVPRSANVSGIFYLRKISLVNYNYRTFTFALLCDTAAPCGQHALGLEQFLCSELNICFPSIDIFF